MVTYTESFIIYGWCEGNNKYCIDNEWISDYGIHIFTNLIIDNTVTEIIYGIPCEIDVVSGCPIIDNLEKKHIETTYNKILNYYPEGYLTFSDLGYYMAVWSTSFNFQDICFYIPDQKHPSSESVSIYETPVSSLSSSIENTHINNDADDESSN
jgi:hypothetical protein